jgi:hypothetical protein
MVGAEPNMTIDVTIPNTSRLASVASAAWAVCVACLLAGVACDAADLDGGPCEYEAVDEYRGVITSIERASSEADAPYLVEIEITDAEKHDVQPTCELRIDHTEADAVESEGIAVGRALTLDRMEITRGACTPEAFAVRDLDLANTECY